MPKQGTIIKICLATGTSALWLLTGRGPQKGPPLPPSMIDNIMDGAWSDGPTAGEVLGPMTVSPEISARVLGLKAERKITDPDRVELAVSHLVELDLPKAEREALADLVRDLASDPDLRRQLIDYYAFLKFKGGGK